MSNPIRIALVGLGKIARDQHIPTIEASSDFELVSLVSRSSEQESYPVFRSLREALAGGPEIDAVSLCTPPQVRFSLAEEALKAGCAVLIEKPPAKTLGAAKALMDLHRIYETPVFFSWHSRFAPFVAEAKDWVQGRSIKSARIIWKEDAETWHPGQHWLWQAGGFGVFDPGINALSILTELLNGPVHVSRANFQARPSDQTPVTAELNFSIGETSVMGTFDFRERDREIWSLTLKDTSGETLDLYAGGAEISVNGEIRRSMPENEYAGVYEEFATLIRSGASSLDIRPLDIVADAFLIARWSRG